MTVWVSKLWLTNKHRICPRWHAAKATVGRWDLYYAHSKLRSISFLWKRLWQEQLFRVLPLRYPLAMDTRTPCNLRWRHNAPRGALFATSPRGWKLGPCIYLSWPSTTPIVSLSWSVISTWFSTPTSSSRRRVSELRLSFQELHGWKPPRSLGPS